MAVKRFSFQVCHSSCQGRNCVCVCVGGVSIDFCLQFELYCFFFSFFFQTFLIHVGTLFSSCFVHCLSALDKLVTILFSNILPFESVMQTNSIKYIQHII